MGKQAAKAWRKVKVVRIGSGKISAWQTDPRTALNSHQPLALALVPPVGLENFIDPEKLGDDDVQFIHGVKGSGKTSLMLAKRAALIEKVSQGELLCVPTDYPYVFTPDPEGERIVFSSRASLSFENPDAWKFAWLLLLGAFVLNAIDRNASTRLGKPANRLLSRDLIQLLHGNRDSIPEYLDEDRWVRYFKSLIELSENSKGSPRKALEEQYESHVRTALQSLRLLGIRRQILVFVDGFDETFYGPGGSPLMALVKSKTFRVTDDTTQADGDEQNRLARRVWVYAQASLLSVANELAKQSGGIIRLFATMRSEAYWQANTEGSVAAGQRANYVRQIEYTPAHLEAIFRANIRAALRLTEITRPANPDEFIQFFGSTEIEPPETGLREPIFQMLCRHSLEEPRDLMLMGVELANRQEELADASVAYEIVSRATETILSDYCRFMDEPWDSSFAAKVLQQIPANVLGEAEIAKLSTTSENGDASIEYLFQRGLLGTVERQVQVFPLGRRRTPLLRSEIYLVHPVLDAAIAQARKAAGMPAYEIREGAPVGNGLPWHSSMLKKGIRIKLNGPRVDLTIHRISLSESNNRVGGTFTSLSNKNTAFLIACLIEMWDQKTDLVGIDRILARINDEAIRPKYLRNPKSRLGSSQTNTIEYLRKQFSTDASRYPYILDCINDIFRGQAVGCKMTFIKLEQLIGVDGVSYRDIDVIRA